MCTILSKTDLPLEVFATGRTRQWLANSQMGSCSTALLENYFEKGGFVPPHYHETEELLVCIEGEGEIVVDGKPYSFCAGVTAIIPAQAMHEVHNVGQGTMRIFGFFPQADPVTIWV